MIYTAVTDRILTKDGEQVVYALIITYGVDSNYDSMLLSSFHELPT